MGLGVEDPLVVVVSVDLVGGLAGLDEVAVLEDLGEPEALLGVVEGAAVGGVDVGDGAEADARAARLVDVQEGVPRPVLVLGVARRAVRVVVALDHLGPQDVRRRRDPEPVLGVERGLVARRRPVVATRVAHPAVLPAEALGAYPCCRAEVGRVAALDELEAELDVFVVV